MPTQAPQWTEFLSCPICYNVFNERIYRPISLGCGHTVCKLCLVKLPQRKCPFDQSLITRNLEDLPVNFALLQLVGVAVPEEPIASPELTDHAEWYLSAKRSIEELAILLKPVSVSPGGAAMGGSAGAAGAALSRPMQRKLVGLVNCQLVEEEGRARAVRAARSLGERTVTEMILLHQNSQQLSANLWAAVRARGCQFLGPAMQEEVLKLILLALEDGSALSRKVLVLFVVQRLASQYPQASKTAIGHVVQLLYRASCFKVTKREEESSLMQLKEEFRTYETLRREHDSQIVQIATEAGLRISPEQWSSLLYGDTAHKSHMQSIIDKLQTPQSFVQSVNELAVALQRNGDPGNLSRLRPHYELLANVDPSPDTPPPSWENLEAVIKAVKTAVQGLVEFSDNSSGLRKSEPLLAQGNSKYKTHMCRDLAQKGRCPRGNNCTFAHSQDEMERYRLRSKRLVKSGATTPISVMTSSALSPSEHQQLAEVAKAAQAKMLAMSGGVAEPPRPAVVHPFHLDRMPRAAVSVPVMKPSILPASVKSAGIRQAIYTSPTALTGDAPHRVDPTVPISMVPSMHTKTVHSNYSGESLEQETGKDSMRLVSEAGPSVAVAFPNQATYAPLRAPPHPAGPVYPPRHVPVNTQAHLGLGMSPPPSVNPASAHAVYTTGMKRSDLDRDFPTPDKKTMQEAVEFPLNPYTTEMHSTATPDSHYYLASNVAKRTRGKSPSQQLGELHQRRSELIAQLQKSKSPTTTENAVPPVAEVRPTSVSFAKDDYSRRAVSLSKSVADTVATALSTMSVATPEKPKYPAESGYHVAHFQSVRWSTDDGAHVHSHHFADDYDDMDEEPFAAVGPDARWLDDDGYGYFKEKSPSWKDEDEDLATFEETEDDEFVPFEHNVVSKYGPISRMVKAKLKNSAPVQVTAAQTDAGVTAVTAVTPIKRPFPISQQMPSRFGQPADEVVLLGNMTPIPEMAAAPEPPRAGGGSTNGAKAPHDHVADPVGVRVATSLPTALLQPNLIAVSNNSEPQSVWKLRERLGTDLGRNVAPGASSTPQVINLPPTQTVIDVSGEAKKGKICQQLRKLNEQIENLQTSEEERLARELQAIELNIQEAERKIHHGGQEAEKRAQVEGDRRLAQQIVLNEARQKGFLQQQE